MTTKEMLENNLTPEEMAKQITKEATEASDAREAKIKAIASKLAITYEQAESFVKQEETRKEASKRYRQSDAYKTRLAMQKVVRQMLKESK